MKSNVQYILPSGIFKSAIHWKFISLQSELLSLNQNKQTNKKLIAYLYQNLCRGKEALLYTAGVNF